MSRRFRGQNKRLAAFVLAALTLFLAPQTSYAGTSTVMGSWALVDPTTSVPTIPTPAGTQRTSWTLFDGGNFHFVAYPFTVDATGVYSATASTPVVVNTTYFLTGIFTHGTPPPTPIGNFFAGVYTGSIKTAGQYTGNFSNLSLVAGQQYTALVAYDTGGLAGEISTVTIAGPGCISIGSNTCNASVPTLSAWGFLILAAMIVAVGAEQIRGRRQLT